MDLPDSSKHPGGRSSYHPPTPPPPRQVVCPRSQLQGKDRQVRSRLRDAGAAVPSVAQHSLRRAALAESARAGRQRPLSGSEASPGSVLWVPRCLWGECYGKPTPLPPLCQEQPLPSSVPPGRSAASTRLHEQEIAVAHLNFLFLASPGKEMTEKKDLELYFYKST